MPHKEVFGELAMSFYEFRDIVLLGLAADIIGDVDGKEVTGIDVIPPLPAEPA